MIKKIKSIVLHPFFSSSLVMIVGTNFSNAVAYAYHLIIGRMLGPSAYGELTATLSLIGIFSVSFTFLGMTIVKFVSVMERNELANFVSWLTKKSLIFGLIIMILIMLATPLLSNFLHIKSATLILVGPIIFISFISFVYRSYLQGLLRFWQLVIGNTGELIIRLASGVLLVLAGFSVFGTVVGIFIGTVVGLAIYFISMRDLRINLLGSKASFKDSQKMLKYTFPILFMSIASTSFFSTDVILVKHFLTSHDAGIYGAVSNLAKIIFYGTGPVAAVMFPMVSKRQSEGKSFFGVFFLSMFLTFAIGVGVLTIYWLFPAYSVKILYGEKFLEGTKYLMSFGIFMVIYTLGSLVTSFYLSISKTNIVVLPIFFAIFQVIGITFFHDSIFSIIRVNICSATLLLTSLLIYLAKDVKSFHKT